MGAIISDVGTQPNTSLAEELKDSTIPVIVISNAKFPRKIMNAVYEESSRADSSRRNSPVGPVLKAILRTPVLQSIPSRYSLPGSFGSSSSAWIVGSRSAGTSLCGINRFSGKPGSTPFKDQLFMLHVHSY